MKKNFLMLSLIVMMISTSAFANNEPAISKKVLKSFKKEFPGAQFVKWDENKDYSTAVFVLADYRAEAWFDENGELLGTSRDLFYNQLPLAVMRGIEKKFSDASPLEVEEITNGNGTSYRIVLENQKIKYTVKASPDGEISITDKTKK